MSPYPDLKGRVAVVIGGAGYLCSTLSGALKQAGMRVAILDLPRKVPPSLMRETLCDAYFSCDVTSRHDLRRVRDRILRRMGHVDLLLNGAGTNAPTSPLAISEREIQRILAVNFTGPLLSCQLFGEEMIRRRRGSIINFTSVSAGPPLSKAFVYSAAKAAVLNLTQNLAREWAPYGIRVNALRPGFFPTTWSLKHFIDRKRRSRILNHTPMRRFGKPQELVGAVLWLAGDASSFVTGSIVTVDGGFTAMTI